MNLREFGAALKGVRDRHPEARMTALRGAAEIVRDEAKALIGTEDEAWPPLADATIAEKERLGYTGRVSSTDPLLRTGEFRASIQVGEVTPEHSIVGTDDPIARYLEDGTMRMPPRPVIGTAVFRTENAVKHEIATVLLDNLRNRPAPM